MKRYVVRWMGPGEPYLDKFDQYTADIKKARIWNRRPVVYADEKVIELMDDYDKGKQK